jgi:hypothetical protein
MRRAAPRATRTSRLSSTFLFSEFAVHALVQAGCCQHRPPSSAAAATATAPRRSHQPSPSPSRKTKAATPRRRRRPRVALLPARRANSPRGPPTRARVDSQRVWSTEYGKRRRSFEPGDVSIDPLARGPIARAPAAAGAALSLKRKVAKKKSPTGGWCGSPPSSRRDRPMAIGRRRSDIAKKKRC